MSNNRLHVAYTDSKQPNLRHFSASRNQKEHIQASMERLWLQDPQQFDPTRDCMQRRRLNKTLDAMQSLTSLSGKSIADLGCGAGVFSRMLQSLGAHVDALDAATQALNLLKSGDTHNITAEQGCLPATSLKDQAYDFVVCTEVIGYLTPTDYRMLMAELARLVKSDGYVVFSTELDINTDEPLGRLALLAETEFNIDNWILSYHRLQIKLCRFFETPAKYVKGSQDHEYRQKELGKRKGISRAWYAWNTKLPLSLFWKAADFIFRPLISFLRQNVRVMNILEKLTSFFWNEAGISHALFIGKRRPLIFPVKPEDAPRELKHKRQVWE